MNYVRTACVSPVVHIGNIEKNCEEIADKYNLSVSNVKQCLFEGRKKLKEGMDMVREYGRRRIS